MKGCLKILAGLVALIFLVFVVAAIFGNPPTTPTPTPLSPWSAITAAYIGPDANPTDTQLRESFVEIMEISLTIIGDTEHYTTDEIARAQAIFDAAGDSHDAITDGDYDQLAQRWQSLGRFVTWLQDPTQNAITPAALPTDTPPPTNTPAPLPTATATTDYSPRPLPADFTPQVPIDQRTAPIIDLPTPRPPPSAEQSTCDCNNGDTLNCDNFDPSGFDAQACYMRCMSLTGIDTHRLDGDDDGDACEWSW